MCSGARQRNSPRVGWLFIEFYLVQLSSQVFETILGLILLSSCSSIASVNIISCTNNIKFLLGAVYFLRNSVNLCLQLYLVMCVRLINTQGW